MTGSNRLTRDDWRPLLRQALRVVDSLQGNGYGRLDFRLGGGTVLMLRLDHRLSRDIDLFIDDAQALGFLSPRLNEVAQAVGPRYREAANTLKLILADGDVDFIVAGSVLRGPPLETMTFEGRAIALESTAEILAKKILFRAESFKPRDVFDMCAALAWDTVSAHEAIAVTRPVHAALRRRLESLRALPLSALMADIHPTEKGARLAATMLDGLTGALDDPGPSA